MLVHSCWSIAAARKSQAQLGLLFADAAMEMDTDAKLDATPAAAAAGATNGSADAMQKGDKTAADETPEGEAKNKEPAAPEPGSYQIENPARVVPAQVFGFVFLCLVSSSFLMFCCAFLFFLCCLFCVCKVHLQASCES